MKGFGKGGVLMNWKKVLCSGLFTGLLTATAMTGFALDLTKEADMISRNPSNVYTMYLGMSDQEFKKNFSGVTGWNYNNSTQTKMWKLPSILEGYDNGQIGIVHTYGRSEKHDTVPYVMKREALTADFKKGRPLGSYSVILKMTVKSNDVKKLKPDDTAAILKEGLDDFKLASDNMTKTLGKGPTGSQYLDGQVNGSEFAKTIIYSWSTGDRSGYSLSISYKLPQPIDRSRPRPVDYSEHPEFDPEDVVITELLMQHHDWNIEDK